MIDAVIENVREGGPLDGIESAENPGADAAPGRAADADAQAMKVAGAQVKADGAQSVVAGGCAAEARGNGSEGEFDVVVYDEDFTRGDAVEAQGGGDGFTGTVHECAGHEEANSLSMDICFGNEAVEFFAPADGGGGGKMFGEHPCGVVAGVGEFFAGAAEENRQLDHEGV